MFSGVNKKCSSCKNGCKQYKQIAIITCPNYESKKRLNIKKAHLDPIKESPGLRCKAPKIGLIKDTAITKSYVCE